jgi:hypothetical protein
MASAARRLHEGRRSWIAKMKAEGKPLPFAGFRARGSGTPREARQAAIAMRADERERYRTSMQAAGEARTAAKHFRRIRPRAKSRSGS